MKIDYDGPTGSGHLRTGPLKIGDDWTGIFIRGDEATHMADMLRILIGMGLVDPRYTGEDSFLMDLVRLFESCREG